MLKGIIRVSWILQLRGHCTSSWLFYLWPRTIMLISHCEATFFGSWLLSQQDPRKILCTVSVPLLEQLHLQQDLG